MTSQELAQIGKAAKKFAARPNPDAADSLLKLLGPHRTSSRHICQMIDHVLDYKFLVGTISPIKEAITD